MGGFLEVLLPRLFPDLSFQCVPHEGKQDLEKSIPRKLKAWHEPGVLFCVIRDNDSGDCRVLKEKLVVLCKSGGRDDTHWSVSLARSWRPGIWESQTLWRRLSATIIRGGSEIKRDIVTSDAVVKPSAEIRRLVPEFQKFSGARRIARYLTRERNRSASFRVFITGIENLWRRRSSLLLSI